MSDETDSGPGEIPVVDGSIYGAAAYVTGYLATLVLVVIFEGRRFIGDVIEGAGWIYYNAQFVSIEPRAFTAGDAIEQSSINYVTGQGLEEIDSATLVVPSVVYHAIPIVAFITAGFLLSRTLDVREMLTGVKVGASLAFGGVVLALGGTFVFEVANAMGPNRPTGVLLAGILYPAVFGAAGGVLSVVVSDAR